MKHKPHLSETVKLLEKCVRLPQNLVKKYFFFYPTQHEMGHLAKGYILQKIKIVNGTTP